MAKKQDLHRIRTIRRKKDAREESGDSGALPSGVPKPQREEPTAAVAHSAPEKAAPAAPAAPPAAAPAAPPAAPPARLPVPTVDPASLLAELEAMGPDPMGQLLGETGPLDPEPGDQVTGTVVSRTRHGIFVDIGAKSEAVIDLGEFAEPDAVTVGHTVTAFVIVADHREIRLAKRLSGSGAREMLAEAQVSRIPVEGTVSARNTGGFTVRLCGIEAFCPVSQIARVPTADMDTYIGQTMAFRILEIRGRDVVVSRRDIEQEETAVIAEQMWTEIKVGDQRDGVVTGVEAFGVFVDIGGVQGLVHASELGWDREASPPMKGTAVQVRILSIDPERKRIGLSMKDPSMGPWARAGTEFQVGTKTEGEVTRVTDFGAFVRIAPGLEGLVHISELSDHHVDHPRTVVRQGQKIEVHILEIDPERERISLSMKTQDPGWKPAAEQKPQSLGTFADLLGDLKLD